MILYFRFLMIMLWTYLQGKKIEAHQPLEISFHVLPTDLDLNLHMNNARYASFVDILRLKFMLQTNFFPSMKKLGATPVIGTTYQRFRKSLGLFDSFTVKLQIIYMDSQWIYLDYKFLKNGFICCHTIEKFGASIPGKGMASPHELLPPIPGTEDFPKPPAHIMKIMETEDEMKLLIPKK